MNKLMKRLSKGSFRKSSPNLTSPVTQTSQSTHQYHDDSSFIDLDTSLPSPQLSAPSFPQLPPPPRPPPRRRRKQTAVFYSSVLPLTTTSVSDRENIPEKRAPAPPPATPPVPPPVPPPIPPRSSSIDGCSDRNNSEDNMSTDEKFSQSSNQSAFSNEELIENLTQNLSVMEELNYSLRTKLKKCMEEKSNLLNELAAINIERDQLLQTCKEIDQLKQDEWTCSICLDDRNLIVSTSRQVVATFCGHLFCDHCVNMALDIENVCPTCRKPFSHKRPAFHFLYF